MTFEEAKNIIEDLEEAPTGSKLVDISNAVIKDNKMISRDQVRKLSSELKNNGGEEADASFIVGYLTAHSDIIITEEVKNDKRTKQN